MVPSTTQLFHPKKAERVAVFSVSPAMKKAGHSLIQVALGKSLGSLKQGTVYGPYPNEQLQEAYDTLVNQYLAEGYRQGGWFDLFEKLNNPDGEISSHAAMHLGWRRVKEAVPIILGRLPNSSEEACTYLDALGRCGDPSAIPLLREYAERKLLSRRRSAVEALWNLGDEVGLQRATENALARLPESIRGAIQTSLKSEPHPARVNELVELVMNLPEEQQGLAFDTLYELGTPMTVEIVDSLADRLPLDRANFWRYFKSVFKRAMLREDAVTFGKLYHRIERVGRSSHGTAEIVKSGLDGNQRQTTIFSRKTQIYTRRLAWRFMRQIAKHHPEKYADFAAESIVRYSMDDEVLPTGLYHLYSGCYLLHRVLYGKSKRFVLNSSRLSFRYRRQNDMNPPKGENVREENFPALWDAKPEAYLTLLAGSQLEMVQRFAHNAIVRRHPNLIQQATERQLTGMVGVSYEPTVSLAVSELERRFDPANPNWLLLDELLKSSTTTARELGERWLRMTAPMWTRDPVRLMAFLCSPNPLTQQLASELAVPSLSQDPQTRLRFAEKVLELWRAKTLGEAQNTGLLRLARLALFDELNASLTLADLMIPLKENQSALIPLVGELLVRRDITIQDFGIGQVQWLAQNEIGTLRQTAFGLIGKAEGYFRNDPTLLFELAESQWQDTRIFAVGRLREWLPVENLTFEQVLRFLDSSQIEVQDFAVEVVAKRLPTLPAVELAFLATEHPHWNVQPFAMSMIESHLPDGVESLRKVERFLRTIMLDTWPKMALKKRVLEFLKKRGQQDEKQAQFVAVLLGEVVRKQGRSDFENALEQLVRLQLTFPNLESPLTLLEKEVVR